MTRKRIGLIMALVGAIVSIGAGVFVYLQAQQAEEIARLNPTAQVVVAMVDLKERAAITADAVALAKVPADLVPLQAATKLEDVVGKYPSLPMYKNEVVTRAKLVATTGSATPSYTLKEGMTAVTLQSNDLLNSVGAIKAGDRVDLVLTVPLPAVTSQAVDDSPFKSLSPNVTQKMLQDVEVLRVGNFTDNSGKGPITLQLSHQDALMVLWTQESEIKMSLLLRHVADKEPIDTDPVTADYLFSKFKFLPEGVTPGQVR